MHALRVVVEGRVQGVGFRWFVRQEARRLGVAGWVRNLPDGSVELTVSGAMEAARRLIEYARVGPEHADVRHVHVVEVQLHDPLPYPFSVLK